MAVVRKSEPPLLGCWGMRDIDNGAPVMPDTVFPICSVTKSFTATALALRVTDRVPAPAAIRNVDRCIPGAADGVYRLGNIVFRIALDDAGRLTFTRNQAATERLLPRHGNIFGFADSEFFRIEFRRNVAGEVDGLVFHEPTGTYLAERAE